MIHLHRSKSVMSWRLCRVLLKISGWCGWDQHWFPHKWGVMEGTCAYICAESSGCGYRRPSSRGAAWMQDFIECLNLIDSTLDDPATREMAKVPGDFPYLSMALAVCSVCGRGSVDPSQTLRRNEWRFGIDVAFWCCRYLCTSFITLCSSAIRNILKYGLGGERETSLLYFFAAKGGACSHRRGRYL